MKRAKLLHLVLMVVVGILTVAPGTATAANPSLLWKVPADGMAGSEAGRLDHPVGVAVDPGSGHIYVADRLNARITEFTAWGEFVKAWGWGVRDGASELQSCGPGATPPSVGCLKGKPGNGPGQFGAGGNPGPTGGIEIAPNGDLYVGDMQNFRIQKFDADGNFLLMFGAGVDQGPIHPGDVCTAAYLEEGDSCGAGSDGKSDGQFAYGENGDHIAVGPGGTVFAGDSSGRIQEFEPSGAFKSKVVLESELPERILSLAVDSAGDFYVFLEEDRSHIFKLSPIGTLLNTLSAEFTNESPLAVDSADTLYAIVKKPGPGEVRELVEFNSSGVPIQAPGSGFVVGEGNIGADEGTTPSGLAINTVTAAGATDIYVTGTSAGSLSHVAAYGPPPDLWTPPSVPPVITSQYATAVDSDSSRLGAEINPRFWADTSYYLEYGTGKCSEGGCTNKKPADPLQLGAGNVSFPVATKGLLLSGLAPATTYHYRFTAQSTGGGPVHGVGPGKAEATFTTPQLGIPQNQSCPNQVFRIGPSARLADCRAYEMVSPIEKNNTDIIGLINVQSNIAMLNQSAQAGEKLTYTTSQGFGDSQGTPYVSQYLASRGPDGWHNHGITPPQGFSPVEIGQRIDIGFRAFTEDLCTGALRHDTDPALAPGAVEGAINLYLRQNCGEEGYAAYSPNAVEGTHPEPQGLSADGKCLAYRLAGKIYESCGGEAELLAVLPSGNPFVGESTVGTANNSVAIRSANDATALSANGSRVYWTNSREGPGTIYLRENPLAEQSKVQAGKCTEVEAGKACTIKVGGGKDEKAHFWHASADGSKAIYSIDYGLSPLDGNLYEFDRDDKAEPSKLIAGEVTGFLGASRDASRVYFVSIEALASEANSEGDSPVAGENNLYLFDASEAGAERYRFIGTLSDEDGQGETIVRLTPVNYEPYKKASRVSPDGLHVAFMSSAPLTGYDNTDAVTGEADGEVFVYDATSEEFDCASCNPTGQRPKGDKVVVEGGTGGGANGTNRVAALLPPYTTELYGTRALSEDGTRVYFNGYESLIPGDTNGKIDVYQWEAPGAGDCTEQSLAFSPMNGGCLSLISTGESPSDSEFIDASADGTDVFFTTASSLLVQDPGLIDIYDARAGGGYPPPPALPASCEGEACQGPLAPPNDPTPASSSFQGAGNVKPAARRKAKPRKKQAKHKQAKQHKKKAQKRKKNTRQQRSAQR